MKEFFELEYMTARPSEKLTGIEWAEKYRVLTTESSALPGPFRGEVVPVSIGILNAICSDRVRKVTWVAGTQIGKTETLLNSLGYLITCNPASIMLIYPEKEDAVSMRAGRLRNMIETAREDILQKRCYLSGKRSKIYEVNFLGGVLYLAWATNINRLSSKPIKYLFLDEIDKYPATLKEHGSPLLLAEDRKKSFPTGKTILVSTPTRDDGAIWQSFQNSMYQMYYYMPCPFCSYEFTYTIEGLVKENDQGFYKCPNCNELIDDSMRMEVIKSGCWRTEDYILLDDILKNGEKLEIGFHCNSFYAPSISFTEMLKNKEKMEKHPAFFRVFVNGWLGLPYSEEDNSCEFLVSDLAARVEKYDVLPLEVLCLTAAVDVQSDRLEVLVVGWGLNRESWVIDKVVIFGDPRQDIVWSELDNVILYKRYKHRCGIDFLILITCVDSGFLAGEVYRYCKPRENMRVFAVKGGNKQDLPDVSAYTRVGPMKVKLWTLGVHRLKSAIYYFLGINEPGAGYMHFKDGICDSNFFDQLTAEKLVVDYKNGHSFERWAKVRERNEILDLYVYNLAALTILNPPIEKYAEQVKTKMEGK